MTVAEALRTATQRLGPMSDTARLDAEWLMAHALGENRSGLLLRGMDRPAPPAFDALVARREKHEPVAYILGEQEFYGRLFRVTPETLIPRPDSETLVEAALSVLDRAANGRIIDLGTGSGALLLSVLAERPGMRGVGIDTSPGALNVARENAEKLGLREKASFQECGWHAAGKGSGQGWTEGLGRYDLVLANPPYVEAGAVLEPSVYAFEPHSALFAGVDGLDDYRILIPTIRTIMAPAANAILEIGAAQLDAVTDLAQGAGFAVDARRDLANRPRALVLS